MFCSPISLCMALTLDGITATAPPDFTTGTVVSISSFTLTEINSFLTIVESFFLCFLVVKSEEHADLVG